VDEALHVLKQVEFDIAVVLLGSAMQVPPVVSRWRNGCEAIGPEWKSFWLATMAARRTRPANCAKTDLSHDPQLVIDRIKRLLAARANLKK
jgi:hypothetical protein